MNECIFCKIANGEIPTDYVTVMKTSSPSTTSIRRHLFTFSSFLDSITPPP